MWYRHWGLSSHPFDDANSPYVPLPSHDEALFRLVYAIEQGHRYVIFRAESGLGKTTVLRRAIAEIRSPRRRVVVVGPGGGGTRLSSAIAERLGQPAGCNTTWHALDRALRIAALQGIQVILALDDRADHTSSLSIDELSTLAHGGFGQEAKLTIIQISRPLSEPSWQGEQGWTLAIGLQRLTRSQVDDYLAAKLAGAGCSERVFTPRAVTRLHGLSGGIPRGLEQLSAMCLLAGSVRGLEVIPPDVVDGVSAECFETRSPARAWE